MQKKKVFHWWLWLAINPATVQFSSTFSGQSQCVLNRRLTLNEMDSGLSQRGPKAEIALEKTWEKNLGAFCLFFLLVPPFPWSASCKQVSDTKAPFCFFQFTSMDKLSLPRIRASKNMLIMTSAEFPYTIQETSPAPSVCVCACTTSLWVNALAVLAGTFTRQRSSHTHLKTTSSPTHFKLLPALFHLIKPVSTYKM